MIATVSSWEEKNHYLVILRGRRPQRAGYPEGFPQPYPLKVPPVSIFVLSIPETMTQRYLSRSPQLKKASLGCPLAPQVRSQPLSTLPHHSSGNLTASTSKPPHSQLQYVSLNMPLQLSPCQPRHAALQNVLSPKASYPLKPSSDATCSLELSVSPVNSSLLWAPSAPQLTELHITLVLILSPPPDYKPPEVHSFPL